MPRGWAAPLLLLLLQGGKWLPRGLRVGRAPITELSQGRAGFVGSKTRLESTDSEQMTSMPLRLMRVQ